MKLVEDRTPLWVAQIVQRLCLNGRGPLRRRMLISQQYRFSTLPFAHEEEMIDRVFLGLLGELSKSGWGQANFLFCLAHHCRRGALAGFNMAADQIPAIRKALFVPCTSDQQNPSFPPENGACNFSQDIPSRCVRNLPRQEAKVTALAEARHRQPIYESARMPTQERKASLEIPAQFHVSETSGWLVNHRINSALPGYLMVSSRSFTNDLADLSAEALCELGPLLAKAQHALGKVLGAKRVYIGRYGHSPGFPIHFHIIPIYDWVEDLFWQDQRYRLLQTFAEGPGETPTDGAELTFFIWREFCERAEPPPIKGPSVAETIELLRKTLRA